MKNIARIKMTHQQFMNYSRQMITHDTNFGENYKFATYYKNKYNGKQSYMGVPIFII